MAAASKYVTKRHESVRLAGTVTSITPDGRFGFIELDEPYKDIKYVVINDSGLKNKSVSFHETPPKSGTRVTIHDLYECSMRMGYEIA